MRRTTVYNTLVGLFPHGAWCLTLLLKFLMIPIVRVLENHYDSTPSLGFTEENMRMGRRQTWIRGIQDWTNKQLKIRDHNDECRSSCRTSKRRGRSGS
jgi:hypothetical protein